MSKKEVSNSRGQWKVARSIKCDKFLFDFSPKEKYNAFKRVANQRKSSFVTRFFVHLLSHIMKIYHAVKSV